MFCKHCNLSQTSTLPHRCSHKLALILQIHNPTKQKMHHQHTLNWAYHDLHYKKWKTLYYFIQLNIYMEYCQDIFSSMFYYKSYKVPLWKVWIFIQAKIVINCSTKSTYHIALLMWIFPMRGKYKWRAGMGHNCKALRTAKRLTQILKEEKP